MANALIGYTGFVGSTLRRQRRFEALYRSTNATEMEGGVFDLVVCAAAPAQKWIANKEPDADRRTIDGLIARLDTIECKTFVLVSTVDVYKTPIGVTEDTPVDEAGLQAYGRHRRILERFVEERFSHHLVARLPGLVGPGLRKNVIFDLLNDNNLHAIDSRGVFQFYPMVNLWYDLQTALEQGLRLVHLTAAPISVAEVAEQGFGRPFHNELGATPAIYDLRSSHADVFSAVGPYQYGKQATIQAIRTYAQSEASRASLEEKK